MHELFKGNSELRFMVSMARKDIPDFIGCSVFRPKKFFTSNVKPRTTCHTYFWFFRRYPNSLYE